MNIFTLRLEPTLARKLEKYCKQTGSKKVGVIKRLLNDFLNQSPTEAPTQTSSTKANSPKREKFANLVGIIRLGGNAVEDCDDYFS